MKALIYDGVLSCTGANYEVSPQGPVCKLLKVSRLVDFRFVLRADNIAMECEVSHFLHFTGIQGSSLTRTSPTCDLC